MPLTPFTIAHFERLEKMKDAIANKPISKKRKNLLRRARKTTNRYLDIGASKATGKRWRRGDRIGKALPGRVIMKDGKFIE